MWGVRTNLMRQPVTRGQCDTVAVPYMPPLSSWWLFGLFSPWTSSSEECSSCIGQDLAPGSSIQKELLKPTFRDSACGFVHCTNMHSLYKHMYFPTCTHIYGFPHDLSLLWMARVWHEASAKQCGTWGLFQSHPTTSCSTWAFPCSLASAALLSVQATTPWCANQWYWPVSASLWPSPPLFSPYSISFPTGLCAPPNASTTAEGEGCVIHILSLSFFHGISLSWAQRDVSGEA